jgi:hypothetical protein
MPEPTSPATPQAKAATKPADEKDAKISEQGTAPVAEPPASGAIAATEATDAPPDVYYIVLITGLGNYTQNEVIPASALIDAANARRLYRMRAIGLATREQWDAQEQRRTIQAGHEGGDVADDEWPK